MVGRWLRWGRLLLLLALKLNLGRRLLVFLRAFIRLVFPMLFIVLREVGVIILWVRVPRLLFVVGLDVGCKHKMALFILVSLVRRGSFKILCVQKLVLRLNRGR